jgi:hypothetical protein
MELMMIFLALTSVAQLVLLCLLVCGRPHGMVKRTETTEAQRDRMDEGFENLMMFSVNGKTGFEPFENGGEWDGNR